MGIKAQASGQACGASITGIDLTGPVTGSEVAELRSLLLEHKVLSFANQAMDDDDLERFSLCFGPFGDDPYIAPIAGRENVAAIARSAAETGPVFAENWHTDWSFQESPPIATCLFGITIPSEGGDTLFVNQQASFDAMPSGLRKKLEGAVAIHSARGGYAPDGTYGDADKANNRAMQIEPSESAMATQNHSLFREHPDTGIMGIFGCLGYIIGLVGMDDDRSLELLVELLHWQTDERFQYRHAWEADMLVMWDNRSTLHKATSGYNGHERLLHRTTIGVS